MNEDELRQLISSNARAVQALLDNRVEERQEFQAGLQQMQEAIGRLTQIQEGVIVLLDSLDSDRPTLLRRLSSIENKVDRLLEKHNGSQS